MQVLTVLGSARKHGNTAQVLAWVEETLKAGGHSIDRLDVVDHHFGGCTGCLGCRMVTDAPGCVIEDDMDGIYARLLEADAVLFASPLYCWGFTAQLKALIDRCFALGKLVDGERRSLVAGKPVGMLITAGGPYEGNLELIEATFPRIEWYMQCPIKAKLLVPNCVTPDQLPAEVQELAKQMAWQLAG